MTRVTLTAETAKVGAIVYRGNGKVAMRVIRVSTWEGALFVSVVKATTADRPGLISTVQRASIYTTEV